MFKSLGRFGLKIEDANYECINDDLDQKLEISEICSEKGNVLQFS